MLSLGTLLWVMMGFSTSTNKIFEIAREGFLQPLPPSHQHKFTELLLDTDINC